VATAPIKAKSAGFEKLRSAILSRPIATSSRSRSTHRNDESTIADNLPPYVSVKIAAAILDVHRLKVLAMVEDGAFGDGVLDLRAKGVSRALLRIPAEGVKEFLRSRRGKSKAKANA
jgi:hypothetical protein